MLCMTDYLYGPTKFEKNYIVYILNCHLLQF